MKNKEVTSLQKIPPVVKTLFGTAAKKYPLFYVFETLKTIISIIHPFLSIFFTPLIINEICGDKDIHKLITYVAILIIGDAVLGSLTEVCCCKLNKYQERLDNYFSMQIGRHSMGLDFQLTEDKNALDQLDKAKTGMTWYSGGAFGISEQLFMFFGNVIKLVGFIAIILAYAPLLILVLIAYVAVNAIITSKNNKIQLESFNRLAKVNRLFGYFGWNVVDFRYGKDIRLYEAKDMLVNRWQRNTDESVKTWKWQGDTSFKYNGFGAILVFGVNVSLYLYIGILAIKRIISIGTFSQLIQTSNALGDTLNGLVWNIQELMKRCNYAYEYVIFMNYPEAIEKHHDKVAESLHTIEFRDVCFAYPRTDKLILDHINITINPGEKLSIVGLNGAGKTTFIKLLCRLYDPTSGQILVDGKDIKEYDYKEYMKQFAPVFQDFKLFGFSIGENILLKDKESRTEDEAIKLTELVKLVELDGLVEKNKNGIDTTVFTVFDEEGVEPSGGEQQKLAIARAIYKNAPVIILDEPTAALDPVAEYEIYRQFDTLIGEKTAFYISHRLSSCKFCDKIAVFSEGKIAEYGSHDILVAIQNGIYAKMFEAQAQYYR